MIDHYRFGSVRVNGQTYDEDLIVYQGEAASWWRAKGHSVCMDDVKDLLVRGPGVIVFGTGAYGMMRVPDTFRKSLEDRGIEVVSARTSKAVERYNGLVEEGRDAAIAMHLTC